MTDPNNPFAVPGAMPPAFPTVAPQMPGQAPSFPTTQYPSQVTHPAPYQAPPVQQQAPAPAVMVAPAGTFAGIELVDPAASRYPFFTGIDGTHRCEIVQCKFVNSDGNQYFVVDFKIKQTTNGNANVGAIHTWMEQLNSKYRESTMKTIKAFLAAANGVQPDNKAALSQMGDDYVRHVISPANPLASKVVDVRAVTSPQKADPTKDYTKHYFTIPTPEDLVTVDVAAAFNAPTAAPAMTPPAVTPEAFPPEGWQAHPQNPAYFWKAGFPTPVTEQDLRSLMAQGKA